jgi:hypothetical protein
MKWGVHRYQNKDGSLTAAGKKRMNRAQNDAKALGTVHARLEDSNRVLTRGVPKDSKILVTTETKEDFSKQIKDYTSLHSTLTKKYADVVDDVITENGRDYLYVLLTDKKTGWGAEYIVDLKEPRE